MCHTRRRARKRIAHRAPHRLAAHTAFATPRPQLSSQVSDFVRATLQKGGSYNQWLTYSNTAVSPFGQVPSQTEQTYSLYTPSPSNPSAINQYYYSTVFPVRHGWLGSGFRRGPCHRQAAHSLSPGAHGLRSGWHAHAPKRGGDSARRLVHAHHAVPSARLQRLLRAKPGAYDGRAAGDERGEQRCVRCKRQRRRGRVVRLPPFLVLLQRRHRRAPRRLCG